MEWSPSNIKVAVDGQEINFPDQKPIMTTGGRTYVPVRFLAENLGADVDWDNEHEVVIIRNKYIEGSNTTKIHYLKIDSNKYAIANYTSSTPSYNSVADFVTIYELPETIVPVVYNDRTMLPFRYVAELMGAQVYYNEQTNTAHCVKRQMIAKKDGGNIENINFDPDTGIQILSTLVGPYWIEELNKYKAEKGRDNNERKPATYNGTYSDIAAWAAIDQITHPEQQDYFWNGVGQHRYMHYFSGDLNNPDPNTWHGSAWYQFSQTYLKGTKYADLDTSYGVESTPYKSAYFFYYSENAYRGKNYWTQGIVNESINKKLYKELEDTWGILVKRPKNTTNGDYFYIKIFNEEAYRNIVKQSIAIWNTSAGHAIGMLQAQDVGYAVVGEWGYMFNNSSKAELYYQNCVNKGTIYRP